MEKRLLWYAAPILAVVVAAGCATTNTHQSSIHQPEHTAKAEAHTTANVSEPTKSNQSATELLRLADDAFREANKAQEGGDREAALKSYTRMLELLIEADLDPTVYYNLRSEFERILMTSGDKAHLFDQGMPKGWNDNLNTPQNEGDLFGGNPVNKYVISEIEEIQNLYPKNFQYGLARSSKYRPEIERKLTEAGLPRDLVWLAMVESQFHPDVTSSAGAVGMWQFMRGTATRYGLRVDNYVDERRDWQKATDAAVAYLKDLGNEFGGHWPLAVASYNMGEAGMERAIAMNGGDQDLWTLIETPPASDHMQRETKKFFPKLLASVIVGKSPERYGFTPDAQPIENLAKVSITGSYSLATLERASDLSSGTLKRLNPQLVRGVTPPSETTSIVVPAESQNTLLASLQSLKEEPNRRFFGKSETDPTHYTVRRGDSLASIAKSNDISPDDLAKANRMRVSSAIPVGMRLIIPQATQAPAPPPTAAKEEATKPTRATAEGNSTYTVKSGDTMFDIAQKYGVTLTEISEWNKLDPHARIQVGEVLHVRATDAVKTASTQTKRTHVVARGEYPAQIASKYGVDCGEFMRRNNLTKNSVLRIGDKLVVYGGGGSAGASEGDVSSTGDVVKEESIAYSPAPAAPEKKSYKVAKGDTLDGIATKFKVSISDINKWNKLTAKSTIHAGDNLVLFTAPEAKAVEPEHKTYTVAKGDTLSGISDKNKISMADLRDWNHLDKNGTVMVGSELKLYKPEEKTASAPVTTAKASEPAKAQEAAKTPEAPAPKGEKQTYKVAKGDTIGIIATKYGVKLDDLMAWNKMSRSTTIHVGDELALYGGKQDEVHSTDTPELLKPQADTVDATISTGKKDSKTAAVSAEQTYKVAKGDTLGGIASKHGAKLEDFLKWNNLNSKSTIHVGEELHVRAPASSEPEAKKDKELVKEPVKTVELKSAPKEDKAPIKVASVPKTDKPVPTAEAKSNDAPAKAIGDRKTYRVAKGDSPSTIAAKSGIKVSDLLKWNNMTSTSVLNIGQDLIVSPEGSAPAAKAAPQKATKEAPAKVVSHTVGKGDNPTSIAKKYNISVSDLYDVNKWSKDHVLRIGDTVKVSK